MCLQKVDGRRWELICRFEREVREDLVYGVAFDDGGGVDCTRLVRVGHFD